MNRPDFHIELDRLQNWLPGWAARPLEAARRPGAFWLRAPLGFALIGAGIVGVVLPILGFWMVPLGLALLALDVPVLRRPLARVLAFINKKIVPEAG
jgi:hypothetical protein